MRRKIYAGSTSKECEKKGKLEIAGPIKFGDLLQDTNSGIDVVGIADGVFMQDVSIWPREIIHAMNSGLTVFGSSSMGAIRAAELERYGMIGIGEIYDLYKNNLVDGDDEVAILHDNQEAEGLINTSIPLVNIRLGARELKSEDDIKKMNSILKRAKEIPYWERTIKALRLIANSLEASTNVQEIINKSKSLAGNDCKYKDFAEMKDKIMSISAHDIRLFRIIQARVNRLQEDWSESKFSMGDRFLTTNRKRHIAYEYMENGIFITGSGILQHITSQKKTRECYGIDNRRSKPTLDLLVDLLEKEANKCEDLQGNEASRKEEVVSLKHLK